MTTLVTHPPPGAQPRPFRLWLYLLIVFGISWPFQIVSAVWAKSVAAAFVLNGASMCMVTVGTYLAGRYVFRDGFANAGWRWGRWASHLAVLGLAALIWIVPTLADLAAGNLKIPADLNKAKFAWVLLFPMLTIVPAFGEEFGWRGYMLPRLARRMSPRKAVLFHGAIWWAWHIPVLAGVGFAAGPAVSRQADLPAPVAGVIVAAVIVLLSAIPAILHGVVIAYMWARSGSLAVVTLYHAAYDGFRDSLELLVGTGPISGAAGQIILLTLGILFLWKGKWWPSQANPAESPSAPQFERGNLWNKPADPQRSLAPIPGQAPH